MNEINKLKSKLKPLSIKLKIKVLFAKRKLLLFMESKNIHFPKKLKLKSDRYLYAKIGIVTFIVTLIILSIPQPKPIENTSIKVSASEVITFSTSTPSEEPVKEDDYIVANDDPRTIEMPTINTKGFLQKVGIDQNNEIAVPNNVYSAGWYVNSVKPGEQGLSIIDGHVDGLTANGIFFELKNLNIDDVFTVTYGDGTKYNFQVVDKQEVDSGEAANTLYAKRADIKNQLNLITCIGTFLTDVQSYDKRLIVISELVD